MLSANSTTPKYLAVLSGLATVALALEVLSAGAVAATGLFAAAGLGTYVVTFYFLGRTFTTTARTYTRRRTLVGFAVASVGVAIPLYATLVFGIDLFGGRPRSRFLLAATLVCLLAGLADVGWTTGRLAETLAIRRARGEVEP